MSIFLFSLHIFAYYQAIIDIDGNNWSARFNNLLCSNSVVIKLQPDFIEQSHKELEPFVHFIPATIDNLTETVEYVFDGKNEPDMKQIVLHANEWCKASMTTRALATAAVASLDHYLELLSHYDTNWSDKFLDNTSLTNADDLVPCHS